MLSDDATHLSNEMTMLSSQVSLSSLVHFYLIVRQLKPATFLHKEPIGQEKITPLAVDLLTRSQS